MEYRKCFVPTCSNNTINNPNKIFVRIREDLREKWCRDVGVEYCKVYTMYCCEDHFDHKKMPLTPAEKMKRYRDKLKQNPDKLEEIRKKNLERIKSKYKYKNISEMTETEQKNQRKKWKEEKQKQKNKKFQKTACSGSSSTTMADILTDTVTFRRSRPKKDLKNYYQHKFLNEEPRLKPTASICNSAPNKSEDSTELSKLLLQHTTQRSCLLSKVDCQLGRKRSAPSISPSEGIKKRKELIDGALKEYETKSTETSEASDSETKTVMSAPGRGRLNRNLYRRCVNCSLRLPPNLRRRQIEELDEAMYNLLTSWVKPTVLTSVDILCVECFVLLQNRISSTTILSLASPALGHRNICYTCGISIASRKTHKVSQNYPQRNILLRWTPPHHILHLERVCRACWEAATRQMKSEDVCSANEPTVDSVCRVCLAVDVKMYHMKDCELNDMFHKITGIAITENNHSLMELLCWECAARLKAAAAFRSKALLSDSLLQDLVTTGEQIRKTDITTIKEKHGIKSDLSFQEVFHIAHIEDNAEDEESSISENIDTDIVQNTMTESSTEFEDNIEKVKKENIEMEIEIDDEPMVYVKTEMETDEGDNIIDPLFNPSEDSVNFTCTSRERRNILMDPFAKTPSRDSINSTRTSGEGRNAVKDPLAETSSRDSINSTRTSGEGRNAVKDPLAETSSRDSINSTRTSGERRNIVVERHAKTPSRDKIVNLIYTSSGRSNLVVRTLYKKPPSKTT